ncbi:MAG: hypothetical protein QXJ86_00330 [Nitrososphaerales archaeon]
MRHSTAALIITLTVVCAFLATQSYMHPQPTLTTETKVLNEYLTQTERYTTTSTSTFYITITETAAAPPINKTITLPPITTTTTTTVKTTEFITSSTTVTLTATETSITTLTETTTTQTTVTKTVQNRTLRNPTWQELVDFLKEDETNTLIYIAKEFDCSGFAITLRDHAIAKGFRAAYVEIEFTDGNSHALVAFQTVDKGLVYVDETGSEGGRGSDKIAYIEVGKEYGVIALDAVRWRYISTSNYTASEFWRPLIYTTHSENSTYPLTYNYYIEYTSKIRFYYETTEAYSKAVAEYNQGSTKYTYIQLSNWLSNINSLENEIGTWWLPMGVVRNIEIYWSD